MYLSDRSVQWLQAVFRERFGNELALSAASGRLVLSLQGVAETVEFDRPQSVFQKADSDFSCEQWRASSEGFRGPIDDLLPAPSEIKLTNPVIELHAQGASVHYDIPGLTYWMLTRQEEIGRTDLDGHRRFPATSSHAFRHNYLERPIVDEWLDILGQVITRVWPRFQLRPRRFQIRVSHDVDVPSRFAFLSFPELIRSVGVEVLKRHDLSSAIRAPWIWMTSGTHLHPADPFNTFDWLMTQSEQNGLTSAFYFICGRTDEAKDALYDPEMPQIRKLMRDIHQRGHEIGLHPSYCTYEDPEAIAREANRLRDVCAEEGIRQADWGGRMHYLRWDQSVTLRAWQDAGMNYDSTLGYADRPGFRCGTCFEYPAFDVVNQEPLSLRIRPLVAMDCTVISDRYLGLGSTENAYNKFNELKGKCRQIGGTFTLLWHNSFFSGPKDFEIYERLVSER